MLAHVHEHQVIEVTLLPSPLKIHLDPSEGYKRLFACMDIGGRNNFTTSEEWTLHLIELFCVLQRQADPISPWYTSYYNSKGFKLHMPIQIWTMSNACHITHTFTSF